MMLTRSQLLTVLPAIILAVILMVQLIWGKYDATDTDNNRSTVNLPKLLQFRLPPIDQAYTELLDRPINLPNRRQPPLPEAKLDKPTAKPGRIIKFKLVGIVISEGNNIALLQETANGNVRSMKVGQSINGMQLEKIVSDKIIFRQGATTQELMLTIETNK